MTPYDFAGNLVINAYGTTQFVCFDRREAELAASRLNSLCEKLSAFETNEKILTEALRAIAKKDIMSPSVMTDIARKALEQTQNG